MGILRSFAVAPTRERPLVQVVDCAKDGHSLLAFLGPPEAVVNLYHGDAGLLGDGPARVMLASSHDAVGAPVLVDVEAVVLLLLGGGRLLRCAHDRGRPLEVVVIHHNVVPKSRSAGGWTSPPRGHGLTSPAPTWMEWSYIEVPGRA